MWHRRTMAHSRDWLVMWLMASVMIIGCHGQFRIVGLLDEPKNGIDASHMHQTNAQSRAISDNVNEPSRVNSEKLIKVHVMDPAEIDGQNIDDEPALEAEEKSTLASTKPSTPHKTTIAEVKVLPTVPSRPFLLQKQPRKYRPQVARLRKLTLDDGHVNLVSGRANIDRASIFNSSTDSKYHRFAKYRNRFKTKCRCSTLDDCPRLQISVSRCETDLFLCCF